MPQTRPSSVNSAAESVNDALVTDCNSLMSATPKPNPASAATTLAKVWLRPFACVVATERCAELARVLERGFREDMS